MNWNLSILVSVASAEGSLRYSFTSKKVRIFVVSVLTLSWGNFNHENDKQGDFVGFKWFKPASSHKRKRDRKYQITKENET